MEISELCCWRKLLKVLWTARRSNQSSLGKSTLNTHWKDWCWSWSSSILVIWCEHWPIGKDPDAEKVWEQKEKRALEDEMARWHHWCNRSELGQTSGGGKRQGGLAFFSPWGHKESDTTEWLNNNNNERNEWKRLSLRAFRNSLALKMWISDFLPPKLFESINFYCSKLLSTLSCSSRNLANIH